MIDWVNAHLPVTHKPLNCGCVMSFDANGSVEWASSKKISVVGSYESKIQLRSGGGDSRGNATWLEFSGNPSKFLQGHNVFGSDNLIGLITAVYSILVKKLSLSPMVEEIRDIQQGNYKISLIDINYMYELPSRSDVLAWIRAAEYSSISRHGRPSSKGGTLYWGKNSRRWALKAYSKAEELQKRKLPEALKNFPIEPWSDNKLRIELRLLSLELKKLHIEKAKDLTIQKIYELFIEYTRKIDMKNKLLLSTQELNQLPNKLKSTYLLWQQGHDCRSILAKSTYYDHRNKLKAFGINIDLERESQSSVQSNVIPLIRILEAKPAETPDWAYDNNLIFTPKMRISA